MHNSRFFVLLSAGQEEQEGQLQLGAQPPPSSVFGTSVREKGCTQQGIKCPLKKRFEWQGMHKVKLQAGICVDTLEKLLRNKPGGLLHCWWLRFSFTKFPKHPVTWGWKERSLPILTFMWSKRWCEER